MQEIKIKTRRDFPVTLGERFVVKNGDDAVVETWYHKHSSKEDVHTYEVEGYEEIF